MWLLIHSKRTLHLSCNSCICTPFSTSWDIINTRVSNKHLLKTIPPWLFTSNLSFIKDQINPFQTSHQLLDSLPASPSWRVELWVFYNHPTHSFPIKKENILLLIWQMITQLLLSFGQSNSYSPWPSSDHTSPNLTSLI